MKCKRYCIHSDSNNVCECKDAELDNKGCCSCFEPSLFWYVNKVSDAMKRNSFITSVDIRLGGKNLRLGIFFVGELFDLELVFQKMGTWEYMTFRDRKTDKDLKFDEILERDINEEKLFQFCSDVRSGADLFSLYADKNKKQHRDDEYKQRLDKLKDADYGFVSPSGEFYEAPFGNHEEAADNIISLKKFSSEYWDLMCESDFGHVMTARDFLIKEKGYCLIHDPSGSLGYLVTNIKPLTKYQKEFLFDYFTAKGNSFKAAMYADC